MARTKLVGITGVIGAGKSLVGNLLAKKGYTVIDTDQVVHDLFSESAELREAIVQRFGNEVIKDGRVDRAKLGTLVFDDAQARHDLEAIVHPAVLKETARLIYQHSNEPVVFLLVPLLFEAHLESKYDEIWTVIVSDQTVLKERLRSRSGMSDEEIQKRLEAQLSQEEKARRATRVIDNSGSMSETEAQIDKILAEL